MEGSYISRKCNPPNLEPPGFIFGALYLGVKPRGPGGASNLGNLTDTIKNVRIR